MKPQRVCNWEEGAQEEGGEKGKLISSSITLSRVLVL